MFFVRLARELSRSAMDRPARYEADDDVWSDAASSETSADGTEFSHDLVLVDEFDALYVATCLPSCLHT